MGETCAADIAKGLTPQDSQTCGSCISAYTEGWKPEDCFTDPGWIKGYVFAFWGTLEKTLTVIFPVPMF